MLKILMAIDDYKESSSCQTLLKKLGFDVMSLNRDLQFHSTTLGFLPDIIIASFKTKNIDGVAMAIEAKRLVSRPRVLLLYNTPNEPPLSDQGRQACDFLLSSPIDEETLIRKTAEMAHLDQDSLHEKYLKLRMRRTSGAGFTTVMGGKDITNDPAKKFQPTTMTTEDRNRRYEDFLEKTKDDIPTKTLNHKAMGAELAAFEEKAKGDASSIEAINAQKLEFAKAMFKK